MTVEQATALMVALTSLIGAFIALSVQLRHYHQQVDGRMTELMELTKRASFAEGQVSKVGDSPTGSPDSAPHTETHSGGSI